MLFLSDKKATHSQQVLCWGYTLISGDPSVGLQENSTTFKKKT